MTKHRYNLKRIFIAWLLLALFMLPMVVKSVHICQVNTELSTCDQAYGQHGQNHNADTCQICHFAFFNFLQAANIQLNAVAITVLGFLFLVSVTSYVRPEVEIISLRAPPTRL